MDAEECEDIDSRDIPKFFSIELSRCGLKTLDLRTGGAGFDAAADMDLLRDNWIRWSEEETLVEGELDLEPSDTEYACRLLWFVGLAGGVICIIWTTVNYNWFVGFCGGMLLWMFYGYSSHIDKFIHLVLWSSQFIDKSALIKH